MSQLSLIYHKILDWSEVWAVLIPLTVIATRRRKWPAFLQPVLLYLIIALGINLLIDLIAEYNVYKGEFIYTNNFLYNIHSILRLLLFSVFFIRLEQHFMKTIKRVIPAAFILFVIINFLFFENFLAKQSFSSRLLSTEAAFILFYCLQYFIFLMSEDKPAGLPEQPGFFIVTGLSVYMAVNFFIFLFYDYLTDARRNFAVDIWDIHNISFIILCGFIARQFYQAND